MISWKHSFKRLNEEYEIAKKKKQALDNLFETGRISQTTRDSFDKDINAVITEIEKQQKDLLMKMQGKAQELENHIKTLETLLANYEIQHVVGEIDEEMYQREITLLSTGLESAKHELTIISEATNQLCPPAETITAEPAMPAEEKEVEVVQDETVESTISAPEEIAVSTDPCSQEQEITIEGEVPEESGIENVVTVPEEQPQMVLEQPEIAEELPAQNVEESSPETEFQQQVTEDVAQNMDEAPEVIEEQAETTENVPQVVEYFPQETEDQPQVFEETSQEVDETPEIIEDMPESTEEMPQNAEEIEGQLEISEEMLQPEEETPLVIEKEPQLLEETHQTVEGTLQEAHPSKAPEEAPEEIAVEVAEEEARDDEEASATEETDEETENQDW